MTKRYLKTPEEVINALKEGKVVKSENKKYKLIDGIICAFHEQYGNKQWIVGHSIFEYEDAYIEEPEPLKLEVGKFYKTRGGKKVIVLADTRKEKFFVAQIGKWTNSYTVRKNGHIYEKAENDFDLVAPWED